MRKIIFIAFAISIMSCSKTVDNNTMKTANKQEQAYEELMNGIKSLNDDFGCSMEPVTKGTGRDVTRDIADIFGCYLGQRFGSTIGASAGAVTGNPVVGVVGYMAGRRYGGIIGSIAASAIAGSVYDWCHGGYAITVPGESDKVANMPLDDDSLYVDVHIDDNASYGDVHNVMLSILRSNGKSYISYSGEVLIEELYNDIAVIAERLDIEDVLYYDSDYNAYIQEYFENVGAVTMNYIINSVDAEYSDCIYDCVVNMEVPEEDAQMVLDLSRKLEAAASLDEDQTDEYEEAFAELVDNSSIDEEDKAIVKNTGSVAIRSKKYWNGEE